MAKSIKRRDARTFTREAWLQHALDVLSAEGSARIRIRALVEELGVTTGSFYWHFSGRDDFVRSMVEYWAEHYTQRVIDHLATVDGGPRAKLIGLARLLIEEDMGGYDTAVRAWAAHEPAIVPVLHDVDDARLKAIRSFIAEAGFHDPELTMRAHTFAVYYSMESATRPRRNRQTRLAEIESRVDLVLS